jgi:hypothetical protein
MPINIIRHFIHKGQASGSIYKGAALLPFDLEFAMSRPVKWYWCSGLALMTDNLLPIHEYDIVRMDSPEDHGRERPSP